MSELMRRGLCENSIRCNEKLYDQCAQCNNGFCNGHMDTHRCRGEDEEEEEYEGTSQAASTVTTSVSSLESSINSIDLTETVVRTKNAQSTKKSWVWTFLSETLPNPTCDICKQIVNYGKLKSTSALISHMMHKHCEVYDEHQLSEAKQKRKVFGSVEDFVVYGGNFMKEYIRWIVETFQPISTCDNYM
jgi:hypothetical protein